jgi:hypothetical protein
MRARRSADGWTAPLSQRRIVSSLTPSWAARSTRRLPARSREASRWEPKRGDQTISSVTGDPASHRRHSPRAHSASLGPSPSLVNPPL